MSSRARDTGIDVFKAILVVLMIYSHVLGILHVVAPATLLAVMLINLMTFSAFMFCFGYVAQLSYFSEERVSYRRIWPSVYRPLIAFYVAAIFIQYVQLGHPLMLEDFVSILSLSRMPYLTEFLVTFSLTLLAAAVLHRPLRWLLQSPRRSLIAGVILLLTTFFPYQLIGVGQIGLLVGTPSEVALTFPVLQYFIFFFMGMVFARRALLDIPLVLKMICLVAVIALGVYIFQVGPFTRFPPSFQWIAAGIPFVLLAYVIARWLDKIALVRRWLVPIGENTLIFLVISDVMIFGLRDSIVDQVSIPTSLFLACFIIAAIYFLTSMMRRAKTT